MKKIAVDIDNTICETSNYVRDFAEYYDKEILHKNSKINYDRVVPRSDEWTLEETEQYFNYLFSNHAINIPVKENVVFYLEKLKENDFQIDFITTRGYGFNYDAEKVTKKFFEKNNIPYNKLIIGILEKFKYLDNYDYFIDDSIVQCEDAIKNNSKCKVIMMSSRENEGYNNDKIKKVKNWKEIYEYIIDNN